MLHWFNLELWGPIWPNLAASFIIFSSGIFWAHRKLLKKWEQQEIAHLERHHELKRMLNRQAVSGDPGTADPQPPKENDDHLRP